MEFKGTRGKWRAINNGHYWDITPEKNTQCLGSTIQNKYLNIDDSVEEANAKLIAAAPELLEALINATTAFKELGLDPKQSCYKRALEAINKALN